MSNRVSIKDIAAKAAVSVALVSYVLNGKEKEKRVGKQMAERIREIAKELNYQPNQIARSLRNGSTKTIGLIVADIANPFFSHLTRVIEDEAAKSGYTVLFGSSDEDAIKSSILIETLIDRQVDGFIIVPAEGAMDQINSLIKRGIPLVLMDRYFPELNTCHVCLDNFKATFEATNHLIKQGNKEIAMIAYQSSLIHMQERVHGYIEAMTQANLSSNIHVIEVPVNQQKKDDIDYIARSIESNRNIEALIFATNSLSLNCLYALNDMGIKIPEDLSIVGFDGNEAFDFFYAPLSYVEQPLFEIGTKSVRVLIDLIEGSSEITHIFLKHTLVIRKSSQ